MNFGKMNIRFVFVLWLSLDTVMTNTENDIITLRGVRGLTAFLPCGLSKLFLDGPYSYVVWLKNNIDYVYRYPETSKKRSIQSYYDKTYGYSDKPGYDLTSLRLDQIKKSDEGHYLCRVHYQGSPAVDFHIDFKVVESPENPQILDGNGSDISGSVYQLDLKTNLSLVCEVKNIEPNTSVWWERNGKVIARTESIQNNTLETRVEIINASRGEFGAHYKCFAQNADITEPLSTIVAINMNLPPTLIEIRFDKKLHFEADQPRVVDCVVIGSVPPPSVSWYIDDKKLASNIHREIHDGNYTLSSLTVVPSLKDDKRDLICRAHNANLPDQVFEDKTILHVGFIPSCVNRPEVPEITYVPGKKANVTCIVEADPEPLQFSWTLASSTVYYSNGYRLYKNRNIYASSLVWPALKKEEGKVMCSSFNMVGRQKRSCPFFLVAVGAPLTPTCELNFKNTTEIKITCDNSCNKQPQNYHLELRAGKNIVHNSTNTNGQFILPAVWKTNLTAVLYASNDKGHSMPRLIYVPFEWNDIGRGTPAIVETQKARQEKHFIRTWIALIICTIVLGTFIGLLARCIKYFQDWKDIPTSTQEIADDDASINVKSDGSLQRLPEPLPTPPEHVCTHVTIRLSPERKHFVRTPRRAPRVARVPDEDPIEEENIPDLVRDDRINYYV